MKDVARVLSFLYEMGVVDEVERVLGERESFRSTFTEYSLKTVIKF